MQLIPISKALGCCVLSVCSINAIAQIDAQTTPPSGSSQQRVGRSMIEEVIVTAQKRSENIQDVPIAISAFTGDQLDAKGISDPSGLQATIPGLIYDSIANFAVIYLRGVGTDAFIPSADLSVATYIDGVYYPFSFNLARAFGSVERVEVIKGPQGTLFGRNATGGAISILTKGPDSEEWGGDLQLSYARFKEYESRLFVSGPLTDTLSMSGSIIYNTKDDYYTLSSDSTTPNIQSYQDKGFNVKLEWAPFDNFDMMLNLLSLRTRGAGSALFVQEDPSTIGELLSLNTADEGDYTVGSSANAWDYTSLDVSSLSVNWRLKPFDLKSISAYQDFNAQQQADFDGTQVELISFRTAPLGSPGAGPGGLGRVFTQEFQVLSNDEGWLSDQQVDWIVGAYYLDSTAGFDAVEFGVAGLDSIFDLSNDLPIPAYLDIVNDLIQALPIPNILPDIGATIRTAGRLDTESVALFSQATWAPVDWFDLTVGARYQEEKREVYKAGVDAVVFVNGEQNIVDAFTYAPEKIEASDFSPKIALSVKPTDSTMFYISYAKAFKSGSFNIINLTESPTKIKSETVSNYEIGLKTDFFDRRLRVNGAIFRSEIDDLQSQFLSFFSGGVVQFQNADLAVINGADLAVTWAVTSTLVFDISGTWLDGIYDKFPDASGFDPQTGLLSTGNDYSGNTIVRNPEFTGSAGVNYFLDIWGGPLEFGVDAYYNDGFFYDAQNSTEQPHYYTLSGRVSYLYEDWGLRLTAFGDNVNNAERYLFKFPNDFGVVSKRNSPAIYGVRLNWEF